MPAMPALPATHYSWVGWSNVRKFLAQGNTTTDQPLMLLFFPIMLCCSALKVHLLCSILCSRTGTVVRLLCFLYAIFMRNSLDVADNFIKTVLLECRKIAKYTTMLYHTVTVLLEYIYLSLQFSTNA